MKKVNNISIGNSGEYFVAAELERHGFSVAIPMSNVELFDILAINRTTHKQFAIQVKTHHSTNKKWTLGPKNEQIKDDNIIYFFVTLNEMDAPEYHIVPSKIVAEVISREHQVWLQTPGKNGQPHKDNSIRKFSDRDDKYLDKWEFLQ